MVFKKLQNPRNGLLEWCNKLFEESFVNPFTERCSTHEFRRDKRVPILIPVVIIAVVGTTAIVGGAIGISKLVETEEKVDNLMEELDYIHKLTAQGQEADKHIKNALKIAGMEINRTQLIRMADNHELHSDIAIATYLTYRFAEIKMKTLTSTDSKNRFKLTSDLLEILNTSMPCGEKCPLKYTSLMNCNIDMKRNRVSIVILAREPSENLLILKAEPFTLYNTEGIKKCHTHYSGPEYLIYDKKNNCAQPLTTTESSSFVELPHKDFNCSEMNLGNIVWNKTSCSIENNFDDLQIKYGINYNYIYCYESNITIADKSFPCPNKPFKLKFTTPFTINDFEYSTINNNISIRTKDFMWSQLTNRFLTNKTRINVSTNELFNEINTISIHDVLKEHKNSVSIWSFSLTTTLTIVIVIIIGLICKSKSLRFHRQDPEQMESQVIYEAARQLISTLRTPRITPRPSEDRLERAVG
jgi:hypothetical protein